MRVVIEEWTKFLFMKVPIGSQILIGSRLTQPFSQRVRPRVIRADVHKIPKAISYLQKDAVTLKSLSDTPMETQSVCVIKSSFQMW